MTAVENGRSGRVRPGVVAGSMEGLKMFLAPFDPGCGRVRK